MQAAGHLAPSSELREARAWLADWQGARCVLRGRPAPAGAAGRAWLPAVLLLDRVNPDRLTINFSADVVARPADLQQQIDGAQERQLAHGRLVRPDNLRCPALASNPLAVAPSVLCPRRAAWALTVKEGVEGSL